MVKRRAITLDSIAVSNTVAGDGMDIGYDDLNPGSPYVGNFNGLTIINSTFDNNYSSAPEWGSGLYTAGGSGEISLTNIDASGNSWAGSWVYDTTANIVIHNSYFDNNDQEGLYLDEVNGNVNIDCASTSNNNSGDGIYGSISGTLTSGLQLSGNSGANDYSDVTYGSLINSVCHPSNGGNGSGLGLLIPVTGSLPLNVINVPDNGGQNNALDCTDYSGTELVLPNGDQVLLPCPIGNNASLTRVTSDKLPGTPDSKYTFVSAFDAEVTPALSGGTMTVSFKIPTGKTGSNFSVLHWDGTKWVSLGGSETPPGYFSVDTNLTGDFILVTQ